MSNLNGFIKLHRKLVAWGWYQDYVVKDVFLHLLLTANFKDTTWRKQELKAGQLVTSYKSLAENLGFSVQQIRTAVDKLKSTGEITTKSTNKYTVITVVNWEDYQSNEDLITSKSTRQITNNQQTNNKQITNNQQQRKNNKNIRNKEKEKINKKESAADVPCPPLVADSHTAEGELDLHRFKPNGTPLPQCLIDEGLTWEEFLRIKNQ